MLIQLRLNPTDTRAAKAYRLQVKERLYRFNYVSAAARHSVRLFLGYGANWMGFCVCRKYSLSSMKRSG